MNTLRDEALEFATRMMALSPADQDKVLEPATTGKVPEADREAFAAYQSTVKRCAFCGKALRPLGPRSRRRYCNDACKMGSYRRRIRQVKQPNQESDHGRTR